MSVNATVRWRMAAWVRTNVINRLPGRVARFGHAVARALDIAAARQAGPVTLLVTHDLSRSGAPFLVFEIARMLREDGHNVLILSPSTGPFLTDLLAAGFRVVIDAGLAKAAYLDELARSSRMAICNTVETVDVATRLAARTPTLSYLHEVSLLARRLADPTVLEAIACTTMIWAGSPMCAELIRPYRSDVAVVPYGVERLPNRVKGGDGPLMIGVFGSIEHRKGQDLVVAAAQLLPPTICGQVRIKLFGRVLEPTFAVPILAAVDGTLLSYGGELDRDGYVDAIQSVDAVLISSRDDTLPLVSIDALGLGSMLLLVPTVGTTAWLRDGDDALVANATSAEGICELIVRAVEAKEKRVQIGAAARQTFDAHFSRSAFHDRLRVAVATLLGDG